MIVRCTTCIRIESALALCDCESSFSIFRERIPDELNEIGLALSIYFRILLELNLTLIQLLVE